MMIMKVRKPLESKLRKWPRLYGLSATVYSALQPVHLKEHFIGTEAKTGTLSCIRTAMMIG